MRPIRITQVQIENVFGIKKLSFSPSGITYVKGDNGTGKTSILRAIALVLGGGQNEDALRKGTESGEVRLTLDDGTEVWASLTENAIYYRTTRDDLTARQLLTDIQDEISVNPVALIQARPQDRGRILLEALPMSLSEEAIDEALRPMTDDGEIPDYDLDAHALRVLGDTSSGLIGTLYARRREVNAMKRDKEGTVRDLKESVAGADADLEALRESRSVLREKIEAQEEAKNEAMAKIDQQEDRAMSTVRKEAEEKIEAIRAEMEAKMQAVRDDRQEQQREIAADFGDRRSAVHEKYDTSEMKAKRERQAEQIAQAERVENTRSIIRTREREVEAMADFTDEVTEAINNLRDLRTSFAGDLPDGVTVSEDGEIYNANGVPFEQWNEEKQVRFAVKVADLRRGALGIIPVDGIQSLVGKQREAFIEYASSSDAQFIVTEAVPDLPLTVETDG